MIRRIVVALPVWLQRWLPLRWRPNVYAHTFHLRTPFATRRQLGDPEARADEFWDAPDEPAPIRLYTGGPRNHETIYLSVHTTERLEFGKAYDIEYDVAGSSTRGRGLVVVGELSRWPHTSRTYTLRASEVTVSLTRSLWPRGVDPSRREG